MRRSTMPLSEMLERFSTLETTIPAPSDRSLLRAASEVFADKTRTVTYKGQPVVVLVVAGEGVDPLVEAVVGLEQDMDTLAEIAYRMKDLLRDLHAEQAERAT